MIDAQTDAHATPGSAFDGLGEQFAALLHDECDGRLTEIRWFRADWQRGGARTGYGTWEEDSEESDVVVKIPVGPNEHQWLARLQPDEADPYGVTARLFAHGTTLGGYDFAWVVMERFPVGPLFGLPRKDAVDLMADAAARFYRRANAYPVNAPGRSEDWTGLLDQARESARVNIHNDGQRWGQALKDVHKLLPGLVSEWDARPCNDWLHGDLHPANAMSRSNRSEDPAMLIDFAEVRAGHWVEDAVFLERLYWTRPDFLAENPPVKKIAARRRELGVANSGNHVEHLADIRRTLLAATAPAFLKSEGNPLYLQACLAVLEQTLPKLK